MDRDDKLSGGGSRGLVVLELPAQRDDYDERREVAEALGGPQYEPPAKSAADRLSDSMTEVAARGLTRLNKKNQLMLMTPLPSAVELFDKYEPVVNSRGSYRYRLYSDYAHGKQWALTQGAQAAGCSREHLGVDRSKSRVGCGCDSAGGQRDGEGGERLHRSAQVSWLAAEIIAGQAAPGP